MSGKINPWGARASVVSVLLHPLLVPVYIVVILLFGNTILVNLTMGLKLYYLVVVLLTTCVIPALSTGLIRTATRVAATPDGAPIRRILPMLVALVCYGVCMWMIPPTITAFLLRKFLVAGIGCAAFAILMGFFGGVSAHLLTAGGATVVLLSVIVAGFGDLPWTLCAVILLSGVLASARLYLEKDTPLQLAYGYFGGAAVTAAAMFF